MPPNDNKQEKKKDPRGGHRKGSGRKHNAETLPKQKGTLSFAPPPPAQPRQPAVTREAAEQNRADEEQRRLQQEANLVREQQRQQQLAQAAAERLEQQRAAIKARNDARLRQLTDEVDPTTPWPPPGGGGDGDDGDDPEDNESDDEDDDSDYEPSDDEDEEDEGLDLRPKRRRMKVKPAKDSALYKELDNLKEDILKDPNLKKGQQWWYPKSSPVSRLSINPVDWFNLIVFAFLPYHQFQALVGQSPAKDHSIRCLKCDKSACLQSHQLCFRAMHHATGEIVWCLHRRLKCKHCKATVAEIDPRFLAQLPTTVVEAFPFITSRKGAGIHQALLLQFTHLATKGILYGTFSNMVNELKRFGHSLTHVRFLDILQDRREKAAAAQQTILPEMFPAYQSSGEYHGIDLEPRVLKKHFFRRMDADETYYQTSCQLNSDEGGSADLTFKTAKKVAAAGRKGKIFEASLTKTALSGKIEISRFMHTETNEEIEPLIRKYREVRINAGQTEYRRHESDEGGDRHLWSKVFEELKTKDSSVQAGLCQRPDACNSPE